MNENKTYPIERVLTDADHLAQVAEQLLQALNKLAGAEAKAELEETEENTEAVDQCQSEVADFFTGVRLATHEYKKRARRYRESAALAVKESLTADRQEAFRVGNLITYNQDEYPGLGTWYVQLWEGEAVAARVYGNDREELSRRVAALNVAPPPAQQQAEPVAWVRFCSDGGYEGPIMNSDSRMDSVRRASGAWTPLYAGQPPAQQQAEPVAWLYEAYVWSGGCGSYVWREILERERPNIGENVRNITPLYDQPPAAPDGYALVPIEPTEEQWGGLARDIMMAFDLGGKSPAALLANMRWRWDELPEWMRKELHDQESTAVLSKGTRAVLIYRAMLAAAPQAAAEDSSVVGDAVAVPTIKLGLYGRAFDTPQTRRAYTYQHQPDNLDAYKLGRAAASTSPGGDSIDLGLSLLKQLQEKGFGVFDLGDQQEGGA